MGLFDLFKKDRGYEIHSLEFCEVGKDGKRDTRPSSKHYTDSRYIMPVVKMTSRIDRTVKIKVRITEPSGKTHTYDFEPPLKPVENMSAHSRGGGRKSEIISLRSVHGGSIFLMKKIMWLSALRSK